MNAPATIPLDDIATFLPGCAGEEYELRAQMRGYRNAASALISVTECSDARHLAWMATEAITPMLYTPADCEELTDLAKYARRLMLTAMQAEQLRDGGLLP